LLLRDRNGQLEVLMTRRSTRASFAPGAFVFPGGVVDEADALAVNGDPSLLSISAPSELSGTQHVQLHRIYAQAALREAWEEVHLLLAARIQERLPGDHGAAAASQASRLEAATGALRQAQSQHPAPLLQHTIHNLPRHPPEGFATALARQGWCAQIEEVRSFSHWTTDRDLAKRFDVRFLVARAPEGQRPEADEGEQFEPCWVNPAEALARYAKGGFALIFPTIRTLQQLERFSCVQAVLEHAEQEFSAGRLWRSCPRGGLLRGQDTRYTEDEAPFAELEMTNPDGKVLHRLDWQHDEAVGLLSYLFRLTAPNPGPMTGPGTNTYLLGAPGHWTVVDPGPNIAAHVRRIRHFTRDRISAILCTHSHQDHSPGAFALQAVIEKESGRRVPILGRPSGDSVAAEQGFMPDRILEDGERLEILSDTHLRVVHTPGHASNHLCFLIEEDGLLLSGDHIMNGSTVVINPPDGDMRAYLDALARLETLPIRYILPAHGYVLGRPAREIRKLIRHRLQREANVLGSMRKLHEAEKTAAQAPQDPPNPADRSKAGFRKRNDAGEEGIRSGSSSHEAGSRNRHDADGAGFPVEVIVPGAYAEVSPSLYPLAARSLLAHLIKLEADGKVHRAAGGWRLSAAGWAT
jgi:glyoxylase-like metal-dependent hydrolase (beta-lactamase superfamily II)/8-oxo-dGTP pyrophosphatase MutT (NUDIX family)